MIGVPAPARLAVATPVDRLSPRTLAGAIDRGRVEHPTVNTAQYNVDVATHQVKIAEGALAPTLSAIGSVNKQYGSTQSLAVLETLNASLQAQLGLDLPGRRGIRRHPPGQGDARPAAPRPRHRARPGASDRHPGLGPARSRQGQHHGHAGAGGSRSRSTACARRPASASAPRSTCSTPPRICSMRGSRWSPPSAIGWWRPIRCWRQGSLSPQILGLGIQVYDLMVHYQQVRDAWAGVRTPDGR